MAGDLGLGRKPPSNYVHASIRYVEAVERLRELKVKRASMLCERGDRSDEGGGSYGDGVPCWKLETAHTGAYDFITRPHAGDDRSGWCASCRERERLHLDVKRAARFVGPAYARLRRVVRRRDESEDTTWRLLMGRRHGLSVATIAARLANMDHGAHHVAALLEALEEGDAVAEQHTENREAVREIRTMFGDVVAIEAMERTDV